MSTSATKPINTSHIPGLSVCIATYKRPDLLKLLLEDLAQQSSSPESLIIVDGDPQSKQVATILENATPRAFPVRRYVTSNHANLAYQRYLGWRVAKQEGAAILVYLDDDLRLLRPDSLAKVLVPLRDSSRQVVGCTAETHPEPERVTAETPMLAERSGTIKGLGSLLVSLWGSSKHMPEGTLTPSGNRIMPRKSAGEYALTDWLGGRVMAYRMEALDQECFPLNLFALCEAKCGLGEDTIISRRVRSRGEMCMLFGSYFHHPSTALPNSYPIRSYAFGFATAYSRRLVNDNYRWPEASRVGDRLALWKSYIGTATIHWLRAVQNPKSHRFAFAWGYSKGAWMGLSRPPTAQRLTPGINWQEEARKALSSVMRCEVATAASSPSGYAA